MVEFYVDMLLEQGEDTQVESDALHVGRFLSSCRTCAHMTTAFHMSNFTDFLRMGISKRSFAIGMYK